MTPEEKAAANERLITAYRGVFMAPAGQDVLVDLMAYCHFRRPATANSDLELAIAEGMRRAVLRIIDMAKLTDQQLFTLYAGQRIRTGEQQ